MPNIVDPTPGIVRLTPIKQDRSRGVLKRFMDYVMPEPNSGCWLWVGGLRGKGGYGVFGWFKGKKSYIAHRASYEMIVGAIPDGMHLDHLCRVRSCVNPQHLEPVTPRENCVVRARGGNASINFNKTHCKRGHPLVPGNLVKLTTIKQRICLTCSNEKSRQWKAKKRARTLEMECD